ncbi:lipopolysaccharide biosynthesis protein [Aureibaculum conchae]|uniref:lipopolysaccharide biosynthesis protein n=1 Tax=Aureibaculum sp. 2308TA14-22 TaxID=3108392 RepID=UPI003390FA8A
MKKALKDLTKDTFTYGFASFLGQIIGFLLLPIYTTHLSTKDYGIMAMLTFISLFFAPLANMGVTNAIFRRFNLHKDEFLQIKSLSVGSIFVVFTSLAWFIAGFMFSKELTLLLVDEIKYEPLVKLCLVTSFFVSVGQIFTVVLRAQRRVMQISIVKVIQLLITVGCTIYFVVVLLKGVEGIILGTLIGSVFAFLIQYILCFKWFKFSTDFMELKALLKYGLPFLPHRLMAFGSGFLSQFFIKEFIGLSETGLYNIALRFALPLAFIIGSIQSAWVPIKFQVHREEGENSALIFRQLISFYFIILLLLFAGSITFGPELLRVMTASEYHAAVYLVPFVLLIPVSQGIYFMLGTGFEFTENTKPMPLVSGSGLLVLSVLGYFLIDVVGIYGVVFGLIASWLTMAILIRYFSNQRFYVPINFKLILKIVILFLLLVGVIFSIQSLSLIPRLSIESLTILAILAIFVYFIVFNEDLRTLNIQKYPLFNKLNKFILPIRNLVKK